MHDYGYDLIRVRTPFAYSGVTKAEVDTEFRNAMYEHCTNRLDPAVIDYFFDCHKAALGYWLAVTLATISDEKQHPTNGWPRYSNFIQNEYFYGGTAYWNLRPEPGGIAAWAVYWDGAIRYLEFNCMQTLSGCSAYQDISANDPNTAFVERFKGGELIEAGAQLRCNASDGQCNYRFILWAQRPDGVWDLLDYTSWYVPTGLAPWWDTQLLKRIPLNTEYQVIRWEIYNDDTGRNLDIRYPYFRMPDQYY